MADMASWVPAGLQGRYLGDVMLVVVYMAVIAILRFAVIQLTQKLIVRMRSSMTARCRTRLSEQVWALVSNLVVWTAEMKILLSDKNVFQLGNLWYKWPRQGLQESTRSIYLLQLALRLCQVVVVIFLEDKRQDFYTMLAHHIVTVFLILTSYVYRFTQVGIIILCTLDLADVLLPIVKIFRYLDYDTLCNTSFVVFATSWMYTRHYLFPRIVWSVFKDLPQRIEFGCHHISPAQSAVFPREGTLLPLVQPFYMKQNYLCFDTLMWTMFLCSLVSLELLFLPWTAAIGKVIINSFGNGSVRDVRSEGKDEDESR